MRECVIRGLNNDDKELVKEAAISITKERSKKDKINDNKNVDLQC